MLEQLSYSRHLFMLSFQDLSWDRMIRSTTFWVWRVGTRIWNFLQSTLPKALTSRSPFSLRPAKISIQGNLPARASHPVNSGRFLGRWKTPKVWIKIFKDLINISRISTFYWQEAAFLDIPSINPNLQKPVESGKKGFLQENPGEIRET